MHGDQSRVFSVTYSDGNGTAFLHVSDFGDERAASTLNESYPVVAGRLYDSASHRILGGFLQKPQFAVTGCDGRSKRRQLIWIRLIGGLVPDCLISNVRMKDGWRSLTNTMMVAVLLHTIKHAKINHTTQ